MTFDEFDVFADRTKWLAAKILKCLCMKQFQCGILLEKIQVKAGIDKMQHICAYQTPCSLVNLSYKY